MNCELKEHIDNVSNSKNERGNQKNLKYFSGILTDKVNYNYSI